MRVRLAALLFTLGCPGLLGCKTLTEVSVGYADAITTSSLPGEGPWSGVSVAFPGLSDMDPLSSPSLTRYAVTAEEIESVKVTSAELSGSSGECGLPFAKLELQLVAAELGPTTLATAERRGECLSWALVETELAPWFRQPTISIVALVDGEPLAADQSLSLRVSFLVDVTDKPITE
ncbi:MAG: hypothetical protein R6X02_06600 [Enhygromyxa sp.]